MAQLPTRDEKDAFYFKHRSNTRMDPRIRALIHVYGHKGYGWYWIVMEMLRDQKDFDLNVSGKYFYNAMAGELSCQENSCTAEQARQFIQDCVVEFRLFHMEQSKLYSQELNHDMTAMMAKSRANRINALKGAELRNLKKLEEQSATGQLSLSEPAATAGESLPKVPAKVQQQDNTIQDNTIQDETIQDETRQKSGSVAPAPFADNYRGLVYDLEQLKKGFPVYFAVPEFCMRFVQFADMRKDMGKALHHQAAVLIMDRVVRFASNRIPYALQMLEKSITSNKANVYPIDEDDKKFQPATAMPSGEKKSRFNKFQTVNDAITKPTSGSAQ